MASLDHNELINTALQGLIRVWHIAWAIVFVLKKSPESLIWQFYVISCLSPNLASRQYYICFLHNMFQDVVFGLHRKPGYSPMCSDLNSLIFLDRSHPCVKSSPTKAAFPSVGPLPLLSMCWVPIFRPNHMEALFSGGILSCDMVTFLCEVNYSVTPNTGIVWLNVFRAEFRD